MPNELQGVPPYQKVIIIEDQNKDYTKEKHIPTLKAKHYVPTIMGAAEQQRIDLENAHKELIDKHDQMERELQELRAFKAQAEQSAQQPPSSVPSPSQPSQTAPSSTAKQSNKPNQPTPSTPQDPAKTGA